MGVDTLLDVRRIGRAVKERRLSLDLSQEDLAKRADVSSAYVSRLERGMYEQPGAVALDRISRALGYKSVDAMLSSEPPPAEPPPRAMAAHTDDGSELSDSELRIARTVARMVIDELKREEREGKGQGGHE